MRIGVDIDEVVVKLIDGFFDFYFLKYGKRFFASNLKDYYFGVSKMMDLNNEKFMEILDDFYESELFENLVFVEFAKESIMKLLEEHDLFFITSRKNEWGGKTVNFFENHFLGKKFEIIFSGDVYKNKNKEEICLEKGIGVIIEDSAEHSPNYAEKGIKVLLMDKPWNQKVEHGNIIRVNGWNEILEKIKDIEAKENG